MNGIEDRSTIPGANWTMVRAAFLVIACQIVYVIMLITAKFVPIPWPIMRKGNWVTVRYSNWKSLWLCQVFFSLFSIYQASCCIMASLAKDPDSCNFYWQNCMFGFCLMLYCLYTFLLLKDLAVEWGRTRFLQMFHKTLMVGVVGLIPVGFICSFWGLHGKMEVIIDGKGNVLMNEEVCVLEFEMWCLILVPVLDVLVTVSCIFLFVQPILVLKRAAQLQVAPDQRLRANEYSLIIKENVIAGFISTFLTAWIFITIFISKLAFHSNLAHIDCTIAVSSGLINAFLSGYTTRRSWKTTGIFASFKTEDQPNSVPKADSTGSKAHSSVKKTNVVQLELPQHKHEPPLSLDQVPSSDLPAVASFDSVKEPSTVMEIKP